MARIRHLVIASLAASLLVAALPAASAAGTYAAPEPKYFNICGTASDRLEIPVYFVHPDFGLGGYYVNGAPASGTVYANTIAAGADGIRRMVVTTDYDSGSWTYAFDDQPCGAPAPNSFSVTPGQCDPVRRETTAFTSITNTPDASGQSVSIVVSARRLQDGWQPGSTNAAYDIVDGETRTVQVKGTQSVGLLPGDYEVTYYDRYTYALYAKLPLLIGSCGGIDAPPYEDPDGTGPGGTDKAKPKGSLRQVRGTTRMKVKMVNKGLVAETIFTVTINKPGPGGKTVRTFTVRKNAVKKLKRPIVAPVGTTFVLRALMRTKAASGSFVVKPVEVARARMAGSRT